MRAILFLSLSLAYSFASEPFLGFVGIAPERKSSSEEEINVDPEFAVSQRSTGSKSKTGVVAPATNIGKTPRRGHRKPPPPPKPEECRNYYRLSNVTFGYEFLLTQVMSPKPILAYQLIKTTSGQPETSNPIRLGYNTQGGHRGTLAFAFPKKQMELQIQATFLRDHTSMSVTAPNANTSFMPGFNALSPLISYPANQAFGSMSYRDYNGDLSLGYYFMLKPRIIMKAYGGGKFVYFRNKMGAFYSSLVPASSIPSTLDLNSRMRVIGGGISAGLYTRFYFARDFYFFSDLKGQMITAYNSFRQSIVKMTDSVTVSRDFNYCEHFWDVKPSTFLKFGLAWQHRFSTGFVLSLSSAYELLYWYDMVHNQDVNPSAFQKQLQLITGPIATTTSTPYSLWAVSFGITLGF